MKSDARRSKHRWSRKVFSRYINALTRRLKSRKKTCKTQKLKIVTCNVRTKPKKFKLMAEHLTVTPRFSEDRAKLLKFFDEVQLFLQHPNQSNFCGVVVLNCENIKEVDPSGCAFLFSYIEMFQEIYPRVSFKIKYPKTIKSYYGVETIQPNHVLNHLGLYKQLGGTKKAPVCHTLPPPKLKIWDTKSFIGSDSSLVGRILENVRQKEPNVSESQKTKIYRILIEAVNNCPEHAYDSNFMSKKGLRYKKTRCLFAIIEDRLVVVVADLGVGIRYTLEHGEAKSAWMLFVRMMKLAGKRTFSSKDSEYLQGMINIKNIRQRSSRHHEFSNRGYGGADLQSAIRELAGKLLIMSGKGSLMLDASNPDDFNLIPKDFDTDLNGTLISMSIPLTVRSE